MGVTSQVLRKDKRFGQINTQNVMSTVDVQFRACPEGVEEICLITPVVRVTAKPAAFQPY